MSKSKILRYGPSKVGKTTMLLSWLLPKPLIDVDAGEWILVIDTEDGLAPLYDGPELLKGFHVAQFIDWERRKGNPALMQRKAGAALDISRFTMDLLEGKAKDHIPTLTPDHKPFPSVVAVDSITGIYHIGMNQALMDAAGATSTFGAPARQHWMPQMHFADTIISDLWAGVHLGHWHLDALGHEKFIYEDEKEGGKLVEVKIDITGKTAPDKEHRKFDMIFYHEKAGPIYRLRTQATGLHQLIGIRGNLDLKTGKPRLDVTEDVTYQVGKPWGWGRLLPKLGMIRG